LNIKWIEQLMLSANSSGGIQLLDEVIEAPNDRGGVPRRPLPE
jgi:hypothetical protein